MLTQYVSVAVFADLQQSIACHFVTLTVYEIFQSRDYAFNSGISVLAKLVGFPVFGIPGLQSLRVCAKEWLNPVVKVVL